MKFSFNVDRRFGGDKHRTIRDEREATPNNKRKPTEDPEAIGTLKDNEKLCAFDIF